MRTLLNHLQESLLSLINRFGYRLTLIDRISFLEPLLYSLLKANGHVSFVQIGANDGKQSDALYRFIAMNHAKVSGIVVEPVKDYFQELRFNYRRFPTIIPVNVAIHHDEKRMTMYRVDPAKRHKLPDWTKGIASFNPRHHEFSNTPADVMIQEEVQCISFDEPLNQHQIEQIDLLQIDTEGYDAEIIKHIDFKRIKPSIIRFEHRIPSGIMSQDTFLSIVELLHEHGYELAIEPYDATAYQRDILFAV
jgi:FkbM family methyltransferase